MQLGIGSYTFPWTITAESQSGNSPFSPCSILQRAHDLNVRVVQLCDNLPIPLHQLTTKELDAIERHATALNLQLEVGTRGCTPEHLRTYIALAKKLHSPMLRVVLDTADDQPSLDHVVGRIREIVGDLERANITLAIENHDRFTAKEFLTIVRAVESPYVGICLDTVNSFGALEGPAIVVDTLAPCTVNIHVKDFAVTRVQNQLGFTIEGRPAGQGRLDIPWLLQLCAHPEREISCIIELWTPPAADLPATAMKEQEWAAQSVAYMRSLIKR